MTCEKDSTVKVKEFVEKFESLFSRLYGLESREIRGAYARIKREILHEHFNEFREMFTEIRIHTERMRGDRTYGYCNMLFDLIVAKFREISPVYARTRTMARLRRKMDILDRLMDTDYPPYSYPPPQKMEHEINRAQLLLENALKEESRLALCTEYSDFVKELEVYRTFWKQELCKQPWYKGPPPPREDQATPPFPMSPGRQVCWNLRLVQRNPPPPPQGKRERPLQHLRQFQCRRLRIQEIPCRLNEEK